MAVQLVVEIEHSLRKEKTYNKYPLNLWANNWQSFKSGRRHPNVVMMVGKNAEVADRALLSAK